MNLSELIINDIEPLLPTDKVSDVQLIFNQSTYSHIPVWDDNKTYLGCVSEADAYCFEQDKTVSDYLYSAESFFVRQNTLWLNVLEAFAQNNANLMPVLNDKNNYLGYYELNNVMELFNETPFFAEGGSILIVEKGVADYSFSEISQIVESNNSKVLGLFISKMENDLVQITVKVSTSTLNEIIQSFRRYSYNIISGHEDDTYAETLKARSEYLDKYLNI